MIILDATIIDDPVTRDEWLAVQLAFAVPGDVITIHERLCATDRDQSADCSCRPVTLKLGAKA